MRNLRKYGNHIYIIRHSVNRITDEKAAEILDVSLSTISRSKHPEEYSRKPNWVDEENLIRAYKYVYQNYFSRNKDDFVDKVISLLVELGLNPAEAVEIRTMYSDNNINAFIDKVIEIAPLLSDDAQITEPVKLTAIAAESKGLALLFSVMDVIIHTSSVFSYRTYTKPEKEKSLPLTRASFIALYRCLYDSTNKDNIDSVLSETCTADEMNKIAVNTDLHGLKKFGKFFEFYSKSDTTKEAQSNHVEYTSERRVFIRCVKNGSRLNNDLGTKPLEALNYLKEAYKNVLTWDNSCNWHKHFNNVKKAEINMTISKYVRALYFENCFKTEEDMRLLGEIIDLLITTHCHDNDYMYILFPGWYMQKNYIKEHNLPTFDEETMILFVKRYYRDNWMTDNARIYFNNNVIEFANTKGAGKAGLLYRLIVDESEILCFEPQIWQEYILSGGQSANRKIDEFKKKIVSELCRATENKHSIYPSENQIMVLRKAVAFICMFSRGYIHGLCRNSKSENDSNDFDRNYTKTLIELILKTLQNIEIIENTVSPMRIGDICSSVECAFITLVENGFLKQIKDSDSRLSRLTLPGQPQYTRLKQIIECISHGESLPELLLKSSKTVSITRSDIPDRIDDLKRTEYTQMFTASQGLDAFEQSVFCANVNSILSYIKSSSIRLSDEQSRTLTDIVSTVFENRGHIVTEVTLYLNYCELFRQKRFDCVSSEIQDAASNLFHQIHLYFSTEFVFDSSNLKTMTTDQTRVILSIMQKYWKRKNRSETIKDYRFYNDNTLRLFLNLTCIQRSSKSYKKLFELLGNFANSIFARTLSYSIRNNRLSTFEMEQLNATFIFLISLANDVAHNWRVVFMYPVINELLQFSSKDVPDNFLKLSEDTKISIVHFIKNKIEYKTDFISLFNYYWHDQNREVENTSKQLKVALISHATDNISNLFEGGYSRAVDFIDQLIQELEKGEYDSKECGLKRTTLISHLVTLCKEYPEKTALLCTIQINKMYTNVLYESKNDTSEDSDKRKDLFLERQKLFTLVANSPCVTEVTKWYLSKLIQLFRKYDIKAKYISAYLKNISYSEMLWFGKRTDSFVPDSKCRFEKKTLTITDFMGCNYENVNLESDVMKKIGARIREWNKNGGNSPFEDEYSIIVYNEPDAKHYRVISGWYIVQYCQNILYEKGQYMYDTLYGCPFQFSVYEFTPAKFSCKLEFHNEPAPAGDIKEEFDEIYRMIFDYAKNHYTCTFCSYKDKLLKKVSLRQNDDKHTKYRKNEISLINEYLYFYTKYVVVNHYVSVSKNVNNIKVYYPVSGYSRYLSFTKNALKNLGIFK